MKEFTIKNGAEEIELTINFGSLTNRKLLIRDDEENRLFEQNSYTHGNIDEVITKINSVIAKYTKYGYSEENLNNLATGFDKVFVDASDDKYQGTDGIKEKLKVVNNFNTCMRKQYIYLHK